MAKKKKRGTSKAYETAVNAFGGSIRLLIFVLAVFFLILAARWGYSFSYRVFNEKSMEDEPGTDITVTIPEGSTAFEIGRILEKNGLVDDSLVFTVQERLSAYHDKTAAGTYTLNTSQTATQMLDAMCPQEEDESNETS